ncbi:MAG: hypothetical protein AAF928_19940 [Myxococcota bacterium]
MAGHGWRRRFFHARVAALLSILAIVVLYAANDWRRRQSRNEWLETLEVAIIVVPRGPLSTDLMAALRGRGNALERRLTEERRRYMATAPVPFRITVHPVERVMSGPPAPPDDVDDLVALARYAWRKHRWTTDIDDAVGLSSAGLDARIYVVASPAPDSGLPRTVEGIGEKGGTVGIVEIDLARDTVDLGLFVAAHELFHLLGAEDRYGPTGDVLIPEGLPEPWREPLYPQRYTALMARLRALGPQRFVVPEDLDELRVAPRTAREIGWTRDP